jgi:hypothetical protein
MPSQAKLTAEDAFNQPGGYRQIRYGDFMIVAPLADIKHSLDALRRMSGSRRAVMLRSVNKALASALPAVAAGTAPQEVAMTFCQDVAIWFANEVFDGREQLDATTH